MTPRERTARRLEVETLKQEAMDLDRQHSNLFGSVVRGPVDHVELCQWGVRFPGKQGGKCLTVSAHTMQGLGRWILIAGPPEAQTDLAQFASKVGDARLDLGGCGTFHSVDGAFAAALVDRLVQVATLDRSDIPIGYDRAPYHVELLALTDQANARRFRSDTERMDLVRRLEELAQRPIDPRGAWSFTLKQGLFHGVVRLLNALLADLEDSPSGAMNPTNPDSSPSRFLACEGEGITPRERNAILKPRIKRLSDEALDLDRDYPTFRGAVVVARQSSGSGIPSPLHEPFNRAGSPPNGFCAYLIRLGGSHAHPDALPLSILADLTGDDLGVAYIGNGHGKYVELAGRVADLGFDIAGLGRFGDLPRDQRPDAPDRLLAFLAAFAAQRPKGSTIRADLDPFADEGFGPVPSDRITILDPRGEAGGSPFVILIRQGLFAALGELLALAGMGLDEQTREAVADHSKKSPRTRRRGVNPGTKAITAAYQLSKEGLPVSLAAACRLAGVDRKHVGKQYPEAVTTIRTIASPDRELRRGNIDRRTGNVDGVSDAEE